MSPRSRLAAAALAAAALAVPASAPASAAPAASAPIVEGLAGPLSLSVERGRVFVAQSFAGKLTRVGRNGGTTTLVSRPTYDISGVEAAGPGLLFTLTGPDPKAPVAKLMKRSADGAVRTVANLWRHEKENNPDGHTVYGFRDLGGACAAKVPDRLGGEPYNGIKESHPYATLRLPSGVKIVADAAGNDLVRVGRGGGVSTLAVLPPRPKTLTAANASKLGLPRCTIGHRYFFESVPTDVERGPNGMLYVTSLPGGPEYPTLGARGSVFRVNPANGNVTLVARGFATATNLAISRAGQIFVTELFANRVSTVKAGKATPVATVSRPSAIEWAGGKLYVSSKTFGNGSVVTLTP